ncbi:MAG: hypothetical protein VX470_04510, partial [Planctomycetota bacterium]|nr:hypothetical protein [Planctomycetota bacterium]
MQNLQTFLFSLVGFLAFLNSAAHAGGDIRVGGSSVGRVESDGSIRIRGTVIGKFESNGDIRIKGTVVG